MSIATILFWIWAGSYPFFVLPIARVLLRSHAAGGLEVDGVDRFFASGLALVGALFWPALLPIMFVMRQLHTEAKEK